MASEGGGSRRELEPAGRRPDTMVIVLIGPAGAGKSTVGTALAARIGWRFVDADDYHSGSNIEKMRRGQPLTDDDRQPWLEALRAVVAGAIAREEPTVVACSALKRVYRRILTPSANRVRFVYLRAALPVLERRLKTRRGHFAHSGLLASQLATLEEPDNALVIDATAAPEHIVAAIRRELKL